MQLLTLIYVMFIYADNLYVTFSPKCAYPLALEETITQINDLLDKINYGDPDDTIDCKKLKDKYLELIKLGNQMFNINSEIVKHQCIINEALKDYEKCKTEVEENEKKIAELKQKEQSLESKILKIQADIKELENKLAAIPLESTANKVIELWDKIDEALKKCKDYSTELKTLANTIKEIREKSLKSCEEGEKDLEKIKLNSEEQLKVTDSIDDLLKQFDQIKGDIIKKHQEIKEEYEDLIKVNDDISKKEEEKCKLENENAGLDASIKANEEEISYITDEYKELEKVSKKCKDVEPIMKNLDDRKKKLEKKVIDDKKKCDENKDKIKKIEKDIDDLKKQFEDINKKIKELSDETIKLSKDEDEIIKKIEQENKKQKQTEEENIKLANNVESICKSIKENLIKLSDVENDINKIADELTQQHKELENIQKDGKTTSLLLLEEIKKSKEYVNEIIKLYKEEEQDLEELGATKKEIEIRQKLVEEGKECMKKNLAIISKEEQELSKDQKLFNTLKEEISKLNNEILELFKHLCKPEGIAEYVKLIRELLEYLYTLPFCVPKKCK